MTDSVSLASSFWLKPVFLQLRTVDDALAGNLRCNHHCHRTLSRTCRCTTGLPARRWLSNHVRSCAIGLDVDVHLRLHGNQCSNWIDLANQDLSSNCDSCRCYRCLLHLYHTGNRIPSGASRCGGAWWAWDARLTSELILFFLYLGFISLQAAIQDRSKAQLAGAILLLAGVVNIPIIHYSVLWWHTLHQTASITKFGVPSIHPSMLAPLILMWVGFMFLFFYLLMIRARSLLLDYDRKSRWVHEVGAVK